MKFSTAKEITIGSANVLAVRIGYVGELGFELHIPTEYASHVYKVLWNAGQNENIANVGYRAIESLRMEKGYLYWSSDITPDYTPFEAGVGFRVHLHSKGDFVGRAALEKQSLNGLSKKLCTFTCDTDLPVTGGEAILLNDNVVSLATSASYGYSVKKTILRGYLGIEHWEEVNFSVEVFGERHPVYRDSSPIYDPTNQALKT